jgi:hypothetical protein
VEHDPPAAGAVARRVNDVVDHSVSRRLEQVADEQVKAGRG